MKIEKIGEGEPEYAVVACVHGDEKSGWEAIQKLKKAEYQIKKPLKLVMANEKAFEKDQRFVDVDMNRVFPGDTESDRYEERIAAQLLEEVGDLKIIDLHSTASEDAPFAIVEYPSETQLEMLRSLDLENVADMTHLGAKNPELEFVAVEVSEKSEDPGEDAFDILRNFLAAEGVIEAEYSKSQPEIFEVYETEEGAGFEFTAQNFRKVAEGEVFARKEGEKKVAKEDFYPVLMSTTGYEDMIGFKAEKKET